MATSKVLDANRFQDTFGKPAERAANKVKESMTPFVQEFIRNSPFAVMATSDAPRAASPDSSRFSTTPTCFSPMSPAIASSSPTRTSMPTPTSASCS